MSGLRESFRHGIHSWIIGTLSKDDDDGGENVGYKNEFAFFQT